MKVWYRYEVVKCGKAACKRCPHGPYWYRYTRDSKGGRLRKTYVGRMNLMRDMVVKLINGLGVGDTVFIRSGFSPK